MGLENVVSHRGAAGTCSRCTFLFLLIGSAYLLISIPPAEEYASVGGGSTSMLYSFQMTGHFVGDATLSSACTAWRMVVANCCAFSRDLQTATAPNPPAQVRRHARS